MKCLFIVCKLVDWWNPVRFHRGSNHRL